MLREIAERMGLAISTVGAYLSDPGGKKLAARKDSYRGACENCGARTDGSNGREQAPKLCAHCQLQVLIEQNQAAGALRRAMVEEMWAQGLTSREICARLGRRYDLSFISLCRHRGYALPHRRTPEQLARIVPQATANLARGRYQRPRQAA